MVLDGGYDALLHVDADMVVPVDVIERLTAVDADVSYGLYVYRKTPSRWLCFTNIEDAEVLSNDKALAQQTWGTVVPSYGAGLGCTLIHRHVLEKIAFRTDGNVASDWWFARDCANYGFIQRHDLGCICGHIDGNKAHYPDFEAPQLYRTEKI